jgi:hypothetical protein
MLPLYPLQKRAVWGVPSTLSAESKIGKRAIGNSPFAIDQEHFVCRASLLEAIEYCPIQALVGVFIAYR